MNPSTVALARTARLVREASIPTYSTVTPVQERLHVVSVEMEADTGYRTWSAPMLETRVSEYVDSFPEDYMLSDVDCSVKCWCQK